MVAEAATGDVDSSAWQAGHPDPVVAASIRATRASRSNATLSEPTDPHMPWTDLVVLWPTPRSSRLMPYVRSA
jgi:hypothetical protein